jgi:F-box-like
LASEEDYSAHPLKKNGHPPETAAALLVAQRRDEAARENLPQPQSFPSISKRESPLGKTHPIGLCPSDVLQLIFEAACDPSPWPIETAVTLSAVCRKWRKIAIETPRLWFDISFTLDEGPFDPSYFWSFVIPRIKMVPAVVKIHHLEAETADLLYQCHLERIPVIEHFGLYLSHPEYFAQLHTLPPFLPAAGVDHLLISCGDEHHTDRVGSNVTWDIGKLLRHIPPITKLWLAGPCPLLVTPSTQLTRITFVYLEELRDVDVFIIVSHFTQMSHLELFDVEFTELASPPEIYSPCLIKITICDCVGDDSWLFRANFPTLAAFIHNGRGFSDACMGFIQKHNSIMELELSEKNEQLACVPKIAPQIQSLAVDPLLCHLYTKDASETDAIPFPSLQFLTVVTGVISLTLEDFDGVVSTRCLPISDSRSKTIPSLLPLRSLTIRRYVGVSGPIAPAPWEDSEFLQSARREVFPDADWVDWETVTLSWV